MLEQKLVALIKSLPKSLRRNFVPAPDFAKACLESFQADTDYHNADLLQSLSATLQRLAGFEVPVSSWDTTALADHHLMNFRVVGDNGKRLRQGRNLKLLQSDYTDQLEEQFLTFRDNSIEQDDVRDWNFGDLPPSVEIENNGIKMRGHPALQRVVSGNGANQPSESIALKLFASPERAEREMQDGLVALYKLSLIHI